MPTKSYKHNIITKLVRNQTKMEGKWDIKIELRIDLVTCTGA